MHHALKINEKHNSTWFKIQSYFNALNHVLNGAVAFFMTLYFIREGKDSFSWHVFLTTVGYQLLMAEAILVFYSPNSWSRFHLHKTKKHLHWILQLIATVFIVSGNVIISVIRTTPHFKTVHAITGKKFDKVGKVSLTRIISRLNLDGFFSDVVDSRSVDLFFFRVKVIRKTRY